MTTTQVAKIRGPATAMQTGLLYESSLSGKPWVNLEQVVIDLQPGAVTPAGLKAAWTALAHRHQALRSVFIVDSELGLQIETHPLPDFGFEVQSVEPLPSDLTQFLHQDRDRGADPLGFPNWRVTCLDRGAAGLTLVWTIHHALVDGTAMRIVLEDLHDLLTDQPLAPPQDPALADLDRQLCAQDKDAARAYFQAVLADPVGPTAWLTASDQPPKRIQRLTHTLPRATSDALREAVARMGVTPLNAVQAAWALVQARWGGQSRAVFGLVDSGRSLLPAYAQTVGCMISTLPMQVDLGAHSQLSDLLAHLRGSTLAMRPHGHADLADIRRWTGSPGNQPLFDSIVMLARGSLGTAVARAGKSGLFQDIRLLEEGSAPLTLAVYDDPSIGIEFEYDPSRLPPDRAAQVLGHVTRLLTTIASAAPNCALGQLAMLSEKEHAALIALAQPAHPVATDQPPCIATRFEAVAQATPNEVALINGQTGATLTYAALDQAANGMAQALVTAGLAPGDLVALHLPRGFDHVTALLATLKLGAAFLPLDPDQPLPLLQGLIARAGAKALIAPAASPLRDAVKIHLTPGHAPQKTPPPRPAPDADRLAYVIHTSGSTGVPKGVRGLTGALAAHADAVKDRYALTAADRVLHFAGLGFDVALEEIIPSLLAGAAVVIRDDASQTSIPAFLDLVARHKISVLNLPASFWHVLVEDMDDRALHLPPSVRLMVTGSERINPHALATWQKRHPALAWINGYGPTEATITATAFELPTHAPPVDPTSDVPIGRPLGHARAYLRAFDGSLAPKGAMAALWLGGAAVTGGYLGLPDETAASFTADPDAPGGRQYNTGDLAEWSPDMQLLFHGRRDRQIKLRGYRIDLHQIENALSSLPEVRQAHVALDRDGAGTGRLLAWLVCNEGPAGTDLQHIRQAAAQLLPSHMLPSLIVVGRLPVSANGKIDTRDLPRPLRDLAQDDTAPTAKDSLATTIAQCMAKVLATDFLPTSANFFDHGGESLLALRLVSLIEARTGRACRASDLNLHPTPKALADMLRNGAQGPRFIIPIQPLGTKPTLFAVHVIGNGGELFRPLADALGPDYPVYGLSVGMPKNLGEIDVQRTARVYFDEVQRHHPTGAIALCAVSMAAYFAFELAQLLRDAGREVRVLAVLDAMGPDGRPAVRGLAKIRAHLGQFRRKGLGHFAAIRRHRMDQLRDMRDARRSAADAVTGYNLIAANVRAVETYVPLPYDGPLTVFRADASFWDSPQTIADGLGWASVARGGLALHDLPGDHLSILFRENVAALASHLRRLMG